MSTKSIVAAMTALALFAGACGGDDDTDVANTDDETMAPTGAATTGDAATDMSDEETAVPDTPEGLAAAAGVVLPDDFVLEEGDIVAEETSLKGTYSGDPHGPVATMQAAGWEHLGTREGSFIHDFFRDGICTVFAVLDSLDFAIRVTDRIAERRNDTGTAEQCTAWSEANAREVVFYAGL
ncbi:MAG: hypothetical protein R3249_08570 [Nitriliruptorales bacterium]|nr:hypothetical protein [Nitriliruptorales bacterium]